MQQMIAHHENAVEMAKSLLKFADKDDMFHGPKSKKQVKDLATTIINAQSFQITEMVLCKWPPFEPGNHPSRPEHGLIPRVFAADLNGLSNDFPCVTQYTNEYGVPDPTAPGIPFCSAAWSKRKGTLAWRSAVVAGTASHLICEPRVGNTKDGAMNVTRWPNIRVERTCDRSSLQRCNAVTLQR